MEGRGRSRAKKKAKFFSPKRLTSFLLAAAMVCTNIGSDLSTAYAAGTSSEVTFEMRGADLTAAVEEAIVSENVVTPDDLNFTNGKVDDFKGYLFGEGKLYEAYPEMEGGDVEADMRVFVRLPEDADDMYAVTGDEEVIFLYINNSDETVRFRSRINYMVDGEEKVKQTDSVTVRSYESIFGDEEVNVISDPAEEIPETTVPETETGEVPETPAEDPVATESEMTVSMSPNAAALVSAPGEEATPSEWPEDETDAEVPETTAPEETTVPAEEEPAAEETTEVAETIPAATPSETPAATDSEIENAPKPSYSDIVGIGWSGTAKIYASTLNKLHALDDVEGWKVEYSIAPEGSARIVDGARGVEDGEDLYFGVKNQIGYAVETVLANGEELTADTITDNEDGSQTAWYAVYGVAEEQSIDVVMAETGEHPAFDAELTMEDGTVIHIHADEGVLPAGVTAEASVVTGIEEVVKENVEAEAAEAGEEKEVIASLSYNIDLLDADGGKLDDQIWSGVVEVTFTGALIEEHSKEADAVEIMHVETTKDEEPQADIQAEDVISVQSAAEPVQVYSENGIDAVSFEAEHFSTYTMVFTAVLYTDDTVTVTVNKNGTTDTFELPLGNIAANKPDYTDEGYEFVDARVDNTIIQTVAKDADGTIYVTTTDNQVSGIKIDDSEDIVLNYRIIVPVYTVTYEFYINGEAVDSFPGEFIGVESVEEGDTLQFSADPMAGYEITNATYTMGSGQEREIEPDQNQIYSIVDVTGELSIKFTIREVTQYSITLFQCSNTVLLNGSQSYEGQSDGIKTGGTYTADNRLEFTLEARNEHSHNDKTLNKVVVTIGDAAEVAMDIPFQRNQTVETELGNGIVGYITKNSDENYTLIFQATEGNKIHGDIIFCTNFKDQSASEIWAKDLIGVAPLSTYVPTYSFGTYTKGAINPVEHKFATRTTNKDTYIYPELFTTLPRMWLKAT